MFEQMSERVLEDGDAQSTGKVCVDMTSCKGTDTACKVLSTRALSLWNCRLAEMQCAPYRVRAYTLEGVQVCVVGLGEGDQRLTFPAHYTVGDALRDSDWIRFASELEEKNTGRWWAKAGFQPASIIFGNDKVASDEMPIGMGGATVHVLLQQRHLEIVQEKPCAEVDDITTPPTPL